MGATLSGGGLPLGQASTQPDHFSTDDRWDCGGPVRRWLGLWLLMHDGVVHRVEESSDQHAGSAPL
jgi:hypothetical protein